jgi:vacuolar-type H+-ATPase subunit I/STV1
MGNSNNNKIYLENIEEVCLYDFLYEEIRQNENNEIITTIIYEAIMRVDEVKNTFKKRKINYLYNVSQEIDNPIYEELIEIEKAIKKAIKHCNWLEKSTSIKEPNEEIIDLFFNGIENFYPFLQSLQKIQNELKQLEQKLNNKINIPNENKYEPDIFDILKKYKLSFNDVDKYQKELNRYLNQEKEIKKNLYDSNSELDINTYKKEISKLVTKYRKNSEFNIMQLKRIK